MQKVKVCLEPNHQKMMKKKMAQLSRDNVAGRRGAPIELMLEPENAKKLMKAQRYGKGARIQLSDAEIDGSGLFDFFKKAGRTIKKGWNAWKDSDLKKDLSAPIRKGLKGVVNTAADAASAVAPGFVGDAIDFAQDRDWGDRAVDFIGDKTGAFGLRDPYKTMQPGRFDRRIPQAMVPGQLPDAYRPAAWSGFGRAAPQHMYGGFAPWYGGGCPTCKGGGFRSIM